jgi:hypothetical protein
MRDSTFSSRAYGTRESKEIAIEGRLQFDLLTVRCKTTILLIKASCAAYGESDGILSRDSHAGNTAGTQIVIVLPQLCFVELSWRAKRRRPPLADL